MKKVLLGFVIGGLTCEALLQLLWVTGQFDEWADLVNEKMSKSKSRSRLREKYAEFEAQAESSRKAPTVAFQQLMGVDNDLIKQAVRHAAQDAANRRRGF